MSSLQQAAPQRAAELEQNSEFFREIKLKERVTNLVDAIPKRLAGGDGARGDQVGGDAGRRVPRRAHPHDLLRALRRRASSKAASASSTTTTRRRRTEFVIRDGSRRALVLRAREALGGARRGVARVRDRPRRPACRARPRSRCGSGCGASCRSRACSSARCRSSSSRARTPSTRAVVGRGVLRRDLASATGRSTAGSSGAPSTSARSRSCSPPSAASSSTGSTARCCSCSARCSSSSIISEIGPEEVAEVLAREPVRRARRRRRRRRLDAQAPRMTVLADENQPPVPFTHASLRVLDLAAVRLAAELARRLDEQEHAAHAGVAVRQAAAVGVRRAARRRGGACRPRRTGRLRPACRSRAPRGSRAPSSVNAS